MFISKKINFISWSFSAYNLPLKRMCTIFIQKLSSVNNRTRMMFSKTYFKYYFLFLFLGITIILIYIKTENNYNHMSFDFKETTKIEVSSENKIQHYTANTVKFRNSEMKKSMKINPQENAVLKQIQETCSKYNITNFLKRTNFLYTSKNKALYCWIRKVASTSFTKLFFDMENRYVTDKFYREAEFLAPESTYLLKFLSMDPSIFKFLIVRHPFVRLVSSYRDRIEDNTKFTAQAWIYVTKIFYITRPELFHSNSTTGSALEKMFYLDRRVKLIPTFKEFITYLIQESPSNYDHHWNQYYKQCSLCEINYNFILKLEDYSPKQIDYIFSKLNLPREDDYLITLHTTRGGHTDFNRTCKYFRNLSRKTVLELYEKYKIDFEMFNYKVENYLECLDMENRTF